MLQTLSHIVTPYRYQNVLIRTPAIARHFYHYLKFVVDNGDLDRLECQKFFFFLNKHVQITKYSTMQIKLSF